MKHDRKGFAISSASAEAVLALDRFTDDTISLHGNGAFVADCARANPECVMLQACAALACVYSQSSSGAARARPFVERARARLDAVTERERFFVEGVAAGCAGDFSGALEWYERIAARWPQDLLCAKVAEFHFFETGDARRHLAFMAKIASANPDSSHAQSMYAFALELSGRRAAAEHAARRALELDRATVWAEHCLAHVFGGESRISEGIRELEGFAGNWLRFGQYIRSHNWFHLATLYLAERRFDRVLDAYDNHVFGFQPGLVVEQTDAILLLWYLELAGASVGERWRQIVRHIVPFAHEQVFPFLNAIYLYALARAGETGEARSALDQIRAHAERQAGAAALVWRKIGLPLASGALCFGLGDFERAVDALGPILPELWRGGGSDEQRGVFIQSHFVALIKLARRNEAARALDRYLAGRSPTAVDRYWLDRV